MWRAKSWADSSHRAWLFDFETHKTLASWHLMLRTSKELSISPHWAFNGSPSNIPLPYKTLDCNKGDTLR